ncbi:NAD(P)-dependent oxidoreductase [Kitasatospora aburaviensis]
MASTGSQVERDVVVFGAGGQVGRAVVAEARRRGLAVTAAVRDPERHRDLAGEGVALVRCDVTDEAAVAATARGHAAAVSTVYTPDVPSTPFYAAATGALVAGLDAAGSADWSTWASPPRWRPRPASPSTTTPPSPRRTAPSPRPRPRARPAPRVRRRPRLGGGHPALDLDRTAPGTGRYRTGGPQVLGDRIAQADLAVAVVDQLTTPAHHREQIAVAE